MELADRFKNEVRYFWEDNYHCIICGENGWDALHHIVNPSTDVYVKGKHNTSIYNSCPIHNFGCHLDKGDINRRETVSELLIKVFEFLDAMGYEPKEIDYKFTTIYKDLYI